MADLYSKRKITLGTLIAVFLATSDEALPLMLEYPEKYLYILYLLGIKLLCGIIFGYLIDIILSIRAKKKLKEIEKLNEPVEKEDLEHIHEEHCTDHECCADNIFLEALKHTGWITLYVLIANVALGLIIWGVGGEDVLASALGSLGVGQYFIAGLVGLIPNCAGSVAIVETFLSGGLTFSACVAGLSCGSGVGLLILYKQNRPMWKNILITIGLYAIGVSVGLLISIFGI